MARLPSPPPEITALLQMLDDACDRPGVEVHTICQAAPAVGAEGASYAVHAVTLGNPDPSVPAVAFVGGVHGLERIGTQVVTAVLSSLLQRLPHDGALQAHLQRQRLVFVPLLNPVGLAHGTRCNGRGVDLMRNAPVEASDATWGVGGHRLGPALPWFRGAPGAPMEPESAALCALVQRELMPHRVAISVDCHSGFGVQDRVWFPHARSQVPVAHLAEFHALGERIAPVPRSPRARRLGRVVEPQSLQYTTHGDLWDHLYDQAAARASTGAGGLLLPLTLEIGSWRWVRRQPWQALSRWGLFNPMQAARVRREVHRQSTWLERVRVAAVDCDAWLPMGEDRVRARDRALARWYGAGEAAGVAVGAPGGARPARPPRTVVVPGK